MLLSEAIRKRVILIPRSTCWQACSEPKALALLGQVESAHLGLLDQALVASSEALTLSPTTLTRTSSFSAHPMQRLGLLLRDGLHRDRSNPAADGLEERILYEATSEDPKVFSKPWKMSMVLYRHKERHFQPLEYECFSFEP